MPKGIEYKFAVPKDRRRRVLFGVETPTDFFNDVLQAGPLSDQLAVRPDRSLLAREESEGGRTTLRFLYSGMVGDWSERLRGIFGYIAVIDAAAVANGVPDPRIRITEPLRRARLFEPAEESFAFSFQRPEGADEEVLEKLRAGMLTAANYLQGSISREDAAGTVSVVRRRDGGLLMAVHGTRERWVGSKAESFLNQEPTAEVGHIAMKSYAYDGLPWQSEVGLAISFAGVVATLDPIESDAT